MRTVKRNPFVTGLLALAGAVMVASGAQAATTTTNPAGLLIFPKLLVDGSAQDSIIQLSNTSSDLIRVRCYLVNANSHCSNAPDTVCTNSDDCGGGFCLPGWTETDFRFTLTKNQPIAWRLSEGLQNFPLDGLSGVGQDGQFNADSNIPPSPEDPFIGELKCFQVDEGDNPVARNDLKGEVTIVSADDVDGFDVRKYNAIGLQSTDVNDGNDTLCLGGTEPTEDCPEPEYAGCPNVVILNHFFDDALDPANGNVVRTRLTLVPCSENFLTQTTTKITVQMLIFNEYEQRLSTSRRIECLEDIGLSDIDTRPVPTDDFASIFNFAVQGTLSGQTRLRSVQTASTVVGTGIVGIATESYLVPLVGDLIATDAFNLHEAGIRDQGDVIRAPRE